MFAIVTVTFLKSMIQVYTNVQTHIVEHILADAFC